MPFSWCHRDLLDGILFIHINRKTIHSDRNLGHFFAALGLDGSLFFGLHRAGGLRDIGRPVNQGRNPRSRPTAGHLHHGAGLFLHVLLRPALAKNHHRVGAFDGNRFDRGRNGGKAKDEKTSSHKHTTGPA